LASEYLCLLNHNLGLMKVFIDTRIVWKDFYPLLFMMTEPKKQIDLKLLQKRMLDKVRVFMYICQRYGLFVFVTETLRSAIRQAYLWSIGRTIATTKQKVTRTKNSQHELGLAVDRAFTGTLYNGDRDTFRHFARHCGLAEGAPSEKCHTQDNMESIEEVMARNSRLWESSEWDPNYRKLLNAINSRFRVLWYN